jgi:hypothetical protein
MPIPSAVDMLPPSIQAEIERLLLRHVSLDQILAYLRNLADASPAPGDTPVAEDDLPAEIVSEINRLLLQRVPVERIVNHLNMLSGATSLKPDDVPSRSALGRFASRSAQAREKLSRSRQLAIGMAVELGEPQGSAQTSLITELLQSAIFDLMLPDDGAKVELSPKMIGELAKGVKDITLAMRSNVEFVKAVETRADEKARTELADKLDTAAREASAEGAKALTGAEMIAKIRALYAGEV